MTETRRSRALERPAPTNHTDGNSVAPWSDDEATRRMASDREAIALRARMRKDALRRRRGSWRG